ncbi:response regulator [Bradyrhizobium tunisiense]|uniref:response regulator n=1 Tax=Bradyrhizobium tunisiense TaxID=3278709 RepID=UPI0035D82BD0
MRCCLPGSQHVFARAVQGALVECGFAVDVTRTLDEAAAALDCACYDILLLELALPDGDGLDWLKQLRRNGKSMPAMVISGLNELDLRIASFNGGADDFLPKPLSTVELIARMRAILRRSKQMTAPLIIFGNVEFDPIARQAWVDGRPLRIAHRELCVLEYLLSHAGRTVPRASLEDSIYSFDREVSTNALEAAIYRLRGHLRRSAATLRIRSARSIGYSLELNSAHPPRHG